MLYECMVPVPMTTWNGKTDLIQDEIREHATNCAAMMAEKNGCLPPRLSGEGVEQLDGREDSHYVFRFVADRIGQA